MKNLAINFAIGAKLNSAFNSSLNMASNKIRGLDASIKGLSKTKATGEKFLELEKQLMNTRKELDLAAGQFSLLDAAITEARAPIDALQNSFGLSQKKLSEVSKEYDVAKVRLYDLEKQFNSTAEPSDELARKLKVAASETKIMGVRFNQAKKETKEFKDQLKKAENETASLERQQNQASVSVKRLRDKFDSQKTKLKELVGNLRSAGIATKGLAKSNKELADSIDRAKRSQAALIAIEKKRGQVSQNRGKLQSLGMGLGAAGLAMSAPVAMAMKMESAMVGVNKSLNLDPAGLKLMKDGIIGLTAGKNGITMSATGLADIMGAASQAGVASNELLAFTKTAGKMGIAFDISGKESGDMMTGWRANMGLTQAQTFDLANVVNHLSNRVKASAKDLGGLMQKTGALGKTAGLTTAQTASLGAAFIAVSEGPDVAATSMKNLMFAMTSGTSATKAQQDAFAALGFEAEEMAEMMQEDAVGSIKMVMKEIDKVDAVGKTALLTNLIGREGVAGVAALAGNAELLGTVFEATADKTKYAGSMQKEFQGVIGSTEHRLFALRNSAFAASDAFGEKLLSAVKWTADVLNSGLGFVTKLAKAFPKTTSVVMGLTGGAIALGISVVGLGYAFTFVQGGLLRAKSMMILFNAQVGIGKVRTIGLAIAQKGVLVVTRGWAAAQWVLNAAMSANPIGLVIKGVAALVAGGVLLYKNWDTISAYGTRLFGTLKKVFDWSASGLSIMKTLASGILSGAYAPIDAVKNVFGKVREYLPFSDAKRGPLSALTASGMAIMTTLGAGVVGGGDAVASAVANELGKTAIVAPSMETMKRVARGGSGGRSSSDGIHITFSPTIQVGPGSGPEVQGQVTQALHLSEARLKELLAKVMEDQRRLSYG